MLTAHDFQPPNWNFLRIRPQAALREIQLKKEGIVGTEGTEGTLGRHGSFLFGDAQMFIFKQSQMDQGVGFGSGGTVVSKGAEWTRKGGMDPPGCCMKARWIFFGLFSELDCLSRSQGSP